MTRFEKICKEHMSVRVKVSDELIASSGCPGMYIANLPTVNKPDSCLILSSNEKLTSQDWDRCCIECWNCEIKD